MTNSDKPYDPLAISHVLSRMKDPAQRDFLEAVVDVVAGISGFQQLKNVEERDAQRKAFEAQHAEVYQTVRDVRYQLAQANERSDADAKNRQQLAEYMEHEGKKTDRVLKLVEETGQEVKKLQAATEGLQIIVAELGGTVNDLGERVDTVEGRMGTVEQRVDALESTVSDVVVRLAAIETITQATQRFIEAVPPPPEVQDRMDADA